MNNAESSAIVVAGWHRMSYSYKDHSFISKQLQNHIRKLHLITGNAVTENRFIVFGAGSTQLLNAAVHALSPSRNSSSSSPSPARVVAATPFYPVCISKLYNTHIRSCTHGRTCTRHTYTYKH